MSNARRYKDACIIALQEFAMAKELFEDRQAAIGKALKALRFEMPCRIRPNQDEIAATMGVSGAHLSNLEKGRRGSKWSPELVDQYLTALQLHQPK